MNKDNKIMQDPVTNTQNGQNRIHTTSLQDPTQESKRGSIQNAQAHEDQPLLSEARNVIVEPVQPKTQPVNNNLDSPRTAAALRNGSQKKAVSLFAKLDDKRQVAGGKENWTERSIKMDGRILQYQGPDHPRIHELLDILEDRADKPLSIIVFQKIKESWQYLEDQFKQTCSFCSGFIEITPFDIIVWLVFLSFNMAFYYQCLQNTEVQQKAWKAQLALNLPLYGVAFTIFKLMQTIIIFSYMKVTNIFIHIVSCLTLTLIPIAVFLINYVNILKWYSSSNYDIQIITSILIIPLIYLVSLAFNQFYQWVSLMFNQVITTGIKIVLCALFPYYLTIQILGFILISKAYELQHIIQTIFGLVYLPFLFLTIFSWFLIQVRLFELPMSIIRVAINKIREKLLNNQMKAETSADLQRGFFTRYLNRIVSVFIGVIYLGLEISILILFLNEIQSNTINYKLCFTYLFEMIAILFFLSIGTCISVSKRQIGDTFLYIPFLVAALPSFGLIYLNKYLVQVTTYTNDISNLIIYGPLVLTLFWMTLSLFGVERRRLYLISVGYSCYFFAVPLGVLMPLSTSSSSNYWMGTLAYVLLAVGAIILAAFLILQLILTIRSAYLTKQTTKGAVFDFGDVAYYSLQDYALYLNAVCFIIAFFMISYFFWNLPSVVGGLEVEIGTVFNLFLNKLYAMLFIHPVLFILINLSLRQQSLQLNEIEENDGDPIKLQLNSSYNSEENQQKEIENERIKKLKTNQYIIIFVGTLIPLFVLFPIGMTTSSVLMKTMFLGLSLGIPACFLLFYVFVYIKNMSKAFQNFFQPFVVCLSWFCIFLPLGVLVPLGTIYYQNHLGSDFQNFVNITIIGSLLICMFGVTGFTILLQILLNKEAFDKEFRFVTARIMKVLLDNAVLSEREVAALIFERYVNVFRDANYIKECLMNNKLVATEKYLGEDMRCDRLLISESRWKYLQNHSEAEDKERKENLKLQKIQKEKEKEAKGSCSQCLLDTLYCRFGLEDYNRDDQMRKDEILNLQNLTIVSDDETQQLVNLYDLLPEFKSAFSEAQTMEQDYIDFKVMSLAEELELDPKYKIIKNQSKQKKLPFIDVKSTRTDVLKAIVDRTLDPKTKRRFLMTDHGQSLQRTKELVPEFLHMVFSEFSQVDAGSVPCIIYADLKEMFRLANIISRDGVRVDEEQLDSLEDDQNKLDKGNSLDQTPVQDLEEEDEPGLITEKELQKIYEKNASQQWNNDTLALNESDFAKILIKLMEEILPDKKDSFQILQEFTAEFIYPNLLLNIHKFVINISPANRAFLSKITKYDYNTSPFNENNFNQTCKQETQDKLQKQQKKHDQIQKLLVDDDDKDNIDIIDEKSAKSLNAKNKGKIHPEDSEKNKQLQEIEEKYNSKRNCCRRCIHCTCLCLHNLFWVYPSYYCQLASDKLFGGFKKQEVPKQKFRKRVIHQRRETMGHWYNVVNQLIATLIQATADFEIEKKAENYKLQFNSSNVIAIIGKLSDFYGLTKAAINELSNADVATSQSQYLSFVDTFYVCFALSLLYGVLGQNAAKHTKNNTLGLDEDGNVAVFPHRQFLLTNTVGLLGSAFFVTIMQTYIDTFVCNFSTQNLLRDSSVVCFGDKHFMMMGLALVGLGIYYPLSTFMFPDFQYSDKSLDLKYKSTYLVIYVQAKLLILGVANLFSSFTAGELKLTSVIQLALCLAIMILLTITTIKMQPCYVKWINQMEIVLLVIIIGLYAGALTQTMTSQTYGLIVAGVVIFFSLIGLVYTIVKARQELADVVGQLNVHHYGDADTYIPEIKVTQKVNQGDLKIVVGLRAQQEKDEQQKKDVLSNIIQPEINNEGDNGQILNQNQVPRKSQQQIILIQSFDVDQLNTTHVGVKAQDFQKKKRI